MAMVVKNNMAAISTLNTLNKNSNSLTKSLGKVSTGMRINGAADDASGYAISERMRVQIRSLDQDNRNAQNGSSMMKVAEGAVNSTIEILKTLKEKVINAANDTNTDSDRATIQKELDQSIDQIDDNANVTYNGKYLLDGSKDNKGVATYTHLTNQNLATDTTGATKLTNLASRAGDALQLQKTDQITVSYVQAGKTYSTSFQVGDKTVQDIFNEAENIDTTTKTFATASNESVAAANGKGVANSSDAAAVKKAVAELKATLGHTSNTQYGNGTTKLNFKVSVSDTNIASGKADFTIVSATATNIKNTGISTASLSTYNKQASVATTNGALFNQLKTAGDEANTAYNTMKALGEQLYEALDKTSLSVTNQHISWDHQNGTNAAALKTESYQKLIAQADGQTKALYSQYMQSVDTFAEKKTAAIEKLDEYNSKAEQLGALMLEDNFYDARNSYEKSVDTFLSNLEDVASSQTSDQFSYVNSAGETKTSAPLDENRDSFVKTMISDLRSQLLNVDMGTNASTNSSTVEVAANEILKNVKVNLSEKSQASSVNYVDSTNGNTLGEGGYKTLGTSAAAIIGTANGSDALNAGNTTSAKGTAYELDKAVKNLTGLDGDINKNTAIATALEAAHADALKEYTTPQLVTGSNIGTDAAGKMISTASGQNALTIAAAKSGVEGQIAGFTIGVRDAQGNAKKSAEAALDAFDESIRGKNASADNSVNLQIGTKANMTINVGLTDMRSQALGLKGSDGSTLNIGNRENANAAINVLDNALAKVLDQATTIGSVQSRLEYTSSNLTTSAENVTASESTIRDADMAKEMTEYTKNNVLLQAAQSMLSQANQNSSAVLSLLQ